MHPTAGGLDAQPSYDFNAFLAINTRPRQRCWIGLPAGPLKSASQAFLTPNWALLVITVGDTIHCNTTFVVIFLS